MESFPLHRDQQMTLDITESAFEGKSIARIDNFVVFVRDSVPGDRIIARITKVKKQYAEATPVSILIPSPYRVNPVCRHFGVCGGCKWQMMGYDEQLVMKHRHVQDCFKHIAGLEGVEVLPVTGAPNQFFYRNKMEFSFSSHQWMTEGTVPDPSGLYLGLHVPQRYDKVLDIQECHLQSPLSNAILSFTRSFAREQNLNVYDSERESGYLRFLVIRLGKRSGETMVNLVTFDHRPDILQRYTERLLELHPGITTVVNTINSKKANIAFGETVHIAHGSGVITESLGGLTFTISPASFFQTNTEQAERLYSIALAYAQLTGRETVYDCYSGTGSIAQFFARHAWRVIGIEAVESAVSDARLNAERNGITNCSFVQGDLRDRLLKQTEWMADEDAPDVIVLDPPRSGLHPDVVKAVTQIGAPRIVYVSCNPATQARDCGMLHERYKIVQCSPVDMFPHTYHIENVTLLERR